MKNNKRAIQSRQMKLLQYLKEQGFAEVAQLARLFDISPVTVRRDLDALEKQGYVTRYFGGARPAAMLQENDEPAYMETIGQNLAQKQAIARRAAAMLEDNDTVFINSSSTALLIYPHITARSVVIVTNNGRSLMIQRPDNVELVLTGGEAYGNKQSLVGEFALETLSHITATKCILGVSGISVQGGITSQVIQETAINRMMLRRSNGPKIVVTDYTKIGIERNFSSGSIHDITHLITDSGADSISLERIRRAGIAVEVVEPMAEE
ncbi:MAG: DeoR/GlpR transcriptional regulator [Lachnospiraceae bacterium]|nr:DeoR/GlpR transcriptional regulator [Lachnospiraceae bacterium]